MRNLLLRALPVALTAFLLLGTAPALSADISKRTARRQKRIAVITLSRKAPLRPERRRRPSSPSPARLPSPLPEKRRPDPPPIPPPDTPPYPNPNLDPLPIPSPPAHRSLGEDGSSSPPSTIDDIRRQILDLVNAERSKVELPALAVHLALERAAQAHASDMAERGYFDHVNPDGKTPSNRIKNSGYPGRTCACSWEYHDGENIAKGQVTAEQVMLDWMASTKHRENILHPKFQEIGIGMERGHWVQTFGAFITH